MALFLSDHIVCICDTKYVRVDFTHTQQISTFPLELTFPRILIKFEQEFYFTLQLDFFRKLIQKSSFFYSFLYFKLVVWIHLFDHIIVKCQMMCIHWIKKLTLDEEV